MGTLTKVALSFIGKLKPDRVKARAIAPSIALRYPGRCASASTSR